MLNMNFTVSSRELLRKSSPLYSLISSHSILPILENFLFSLEDGELTLTASDLHNTIVHSLKTESSKGNGK